MYMFENSITIHCDYVEGFHMKDDKEETFRHLMQAV